MRSTLATALILACAAGSACVGRIEDPRGTALGGGPGPSADGGVSAGADGGDPQPPVGPPPTPDQCKAAAFDVGPAPMRRLSHFELNNTVRDLFPGIAVPAQSFAPDRPILGFENNVDAQTVSPVLVEQYQSAAVAIATAVAADLRTFYSHLGLPQGTACPPATGAANVACGREVVEYFGKRAFRRPLTDAEKQRFGDFFTAQLAANNFDVAMTLLVESMLLSPQFLYRVELGVPPTDPGARFGRLDPWETATRLAYFFWSSMPDEDLFRAAADGRLTSKVDIEVQARRLLADPRARPALVDFHRQWLAFDRINGVNKDAASHPSFNDTLRAAMREEQDRFVEHTIFDGEGTLSALLTGTKTWVNAPLAAVYGVPAPADGQWALVDLDPAQRAGLLTQPSFLAAAAHEVEPSPVLRGVFVIERLLCQVILPPSFNVNTTPPSAQDHPGPTTNRQRYAEHVNNAACAGCHDRIDGIGFTMEAYDSLGAYRTIDNGLPVDTKTTLVGTDVDGAIDGPVALAQTLARSKAVERCVATELFRFGFGRVETTEDQCNITAIQEQFAASGQKIEELMIAFATSDAFVTIPMNASR